MNTEQLKQAALAAKTGNLEAELVFEAFASPNKILALLECVDALQALCDDLGACGATEQGRAALQKLEAL